jgi:hypothetical protein
MKRSGGGCLWRIVVPLLMLGALYGVRVVVASLRLPAATQRIVLAVAPFGILLLALVWAFALRARRLGQLDDAFAPLHLASSRYMMSGRRYAGLVRGRQVEAKFLRGQLTIDVFTPLQTRLAVAPRSRVGSVLGGLLGLRELRLDDPAYRGFIASADDAAWGARVLGRPEVKRAIFCLLDARGGEQRSVQLTPGRLSLRRHAAWRVTASEVGEQVDDLIRLVTATER